MRVIIYLIIKSLYTTEISKVHLRHELWIDTDDRYTLFIVKGHQYETKVDLENQLRKKKLYMFDNCPSHKSKGTFKMLKEQNHKVCFLPTYSPNLAPIELWFSFLKQKLREISNKENARLGSIESQNKLLIILRKLTKELIIKYYMKFHKELKLCLNYFN